ncbi:MAG: hypothetical protein V4635_15660 [Bacteroidota bacterium]
MEKFEIERQKYKPATIEYLLVAETPPKITSDRFFYFENVEKQDSLFLETMKCLYPSDTGKVNIKTIRANKKLFLDKFKNDGFYLIDSLEKPFESKYSSSQKIRLIIMGQNDLLMRIQNLCNSNTKIILIAASVYKANYQFLKDNKVNVINKELIDFPGSGGQEKFKNKLRRCFE